MLDLPCDFDAVTCQHVAEDRGKVKCPVVDTRTIVFFGTDIEGACGEYIIRPGITQIPAPAGAACRNESYFVAHANVTRWGIQP